jgi:hypothetical protein
MINNTDNQSKIINNPEIIDNKSDKDQEKSKINKIELEQIYSKQKTASISYVIKYNMQLN